MVESQVGIEDLKMRKYNARAVVREIIMFN